MKKETKVKLKEGLKEGFAELLGEIGCSLIFILIGILVLSVFGVDPDAEWIDDDLTMLIGIAAIVIPAIIIGLIIGFVKKRKKKNIKKIEIYSKNEREQDEKNPDDIERKGQNNV